MRLKKYVALVISAISLGAGLVVSETTAHALQNEWNSYHWVTITKNVTVNTFKITDPMYKSYIVNSHTIKRGSHYKLGHFGTNFAWALESGKYNSSSHYAFVPDKSANDASWFKAGIHKLSKPKPKYSGYPLHKGNYKIAKYSSFSRDEFRTGYYDPTFLPTTLLNKDGQKDVFKLTSGATPLSVKIVYNDSWEEDQLMVQYQGKTAYADLMDITPANVDKVDTDQVSSAYAPFSGKAVVPHGMKSSQIKYWYQDTGSGDVLWQKVKGQWQYHGKL